MIGTATNWSAGVPDRYQYERRVTGAAVVGHAILRRLITRRGSMPWAPDVGYDVRDLLNADFATDSNGPIDAVAAFVRAECLADERCTECTVSATFSVASGVLRIAIAGQTDAGPFRLVVGVADLTLSLLALEV